MFAVIDSGLYAQRRDTSHGIAATAMAGQAACPGMKHGYIAALFCPEARARLSDAVHRRQLQTYTLTIVVPISSVVLSDSIAAARAFRYLLTPPHR